VSTKVTRVTAQALYNHTGVGNVKHVSFKPGPEDCYRRCGSDKIRQTVPDTCSGDQESSVTDSKESRAADNQWWRWTGTESLTSFDICHLTKLVSKVYRCGPVQTLVHEDWLFECNLLWSLQPAQLTKERSDVLEPWREKDEPSGGVHHWLQPWHEIWWNAKNQTKNQKQFHMTKLSGLTTANWF